MQKKVDSSKAYVKIGTVKDNIGVAYYKLSEKNKNIEWDSIISDFTKEIQNIKNMIDTKNSGVTIDYKTSGNTLTILLSLSANGKIYSQTGVLTENGKNSKIVWDQIKETN